MLSVLGGFILLPAIGTYSAILRCLGTLQVIESLAKQVNLGNRRPQIGF